MKYLVLVIIAITAVEIFIRLPIWRPIQSLLSLSQKIPRVLGSKHISDHWKEIVLQRYARDLALTSLQIFAWLLVAMGLLLAMAFSLDKLVMPAPSILAYLIKTEGIIAVTLLSLAYYGLRRRLGRP